MFLFSSVALVSQKFALSGKNFVYRFDCGVLVWEICGVGGSSVFFYFVWVFFFFFCPLFWSTCMVWKELCVFSVLVLILYAYCVSLQRYVWSGRKFSFLVCLYVSWKDCSGS